MTTDQYAKEISNFLNCNRYASLISVIGDQLNSRKDRFSKSEFIEKSIECYSNNRFNHVDGEGVDFIDTVYNYKLEFKYVANGIFTNKKKQARATIKVKIKNSLGKHKGININNPADYYMIGQQDAIGIISWDDIKLYLKAVPDGIEAHIPFNKLSMVCTPTQICKTISKAFNFQEQKNALMVKIIEGI